MINRCQPLLKFFLGGCFGGKCFAILSSSASSLSFSSIVIFSVFLLYVSIVHFTFCIRRINFTRIPSHAHSWEAAMQKMTTGHDWWWTRLNLSQLNHNHSHIIFTCSWLAENKIYQNISEYSRMFQNTPESSKIFQNLPKYSKIFQNVPEYSKI